MVAKNCPESTSVIGFAKDRYGFSTKSRMTNSLCTSSRLRIVAMCTNTSPNTSGQRTLTRGGCGLLNSDRWVNRLKAVMRNRFLNAGIFFAVLIGSIGCTSGGNANGGSSTIEAPPVEVVEGNFARAPYVLEIEVEEVRRAATFRSDSGEVGYVQYSIIGTILEILKSSGERELLSDEIEYRFTQEYDPKADSTIAKGRKYLVFLMLAEEPPRFWVIGNGAQFELCPELSKTVRQIAEQE